MGNNSFKLKILLGVVVTIILIIALGKASNNFEEFFYEKNKIVKSIDNIKHSEATLNYAISSSGLYLYKSNDSIYKSIKKLQNDIQILLKNQYFKTNYPNLYKDVENYNKEVDKKIDNIYEYQTYSAAIKNSIMYISRLLNKLPKISAHYKLKSKSSEHNIYVQKFIDISSKIFLSKNSIDKDILKDLDLDYFQNINIENPVLKRFNNMFLAHTRVYYNYYPKYNRVLIEILNSKTQKILINIDKGVYEQSKQKLKAIEYISYIIKAFILFYTFIIIILLTKMNKENFKLNNLTKELSKLLRTDTITTLSNRIGFDIDTKDKQNKLLYLVNIDKFKYINNYYGSQIGDLVLKKVAKIIQQIVPRELTATFYRLGADDFGILIDKNLIENEHILSKQIVEYFEKTDIEVEQFKFRIGVSVGMSDTISYLETANIALKEVKNSTRLKCLKYSLSIDNKDLILQNIEKTKILYEALKENRVVPYFQPIIDVKTQKIVKYEVLSRVVSQDGTKVESIYPYLQIAKDNKLYSRITQMVLQESIKKFENSDIKFNVNFSIEDIMDESIMSLLHNIQKSNKNIMPNITFELLESESINDYNIIKNFIKDVKNYGSTVAIDDFGSGYSNFEHIINLDIDYIKIDGSLIKNIAIDKNSYNIVELVNKFAHNSNIETVGEFVEDDEIYQVLKEIGIDYAQGYYFGKPTKDI